MLGSTLPRLWTPPLRELTPETSTGFDEIDFARDVVGIPLDPWEEWLSIHAGELLPDGRPRFRHVLALVARQNGKSTWARNKILYWLFVELATMTGIDDPFILATSTDRSYAKKFWQKTTRLIKGNELLSPELARVHLTISEEVIVTSMGVEYGFAANNASAGRSRTIHRALVDEVRQHRSLDAWGAITGAMNAVPDGQVICISNQGDDTSVLLDTLREPALAFIEIGDGDPRLGLFEWSSPPGSDPEDVAALAAANPNLGRRIDLDSLRGSARRAAMAGGEELAVHRTEVMCMRVDLLDPAIDADRWEACGTDVVTDLSEHRAKLALCLDVSMAMDHATLIAAAHIDDLTYLEIVETWSGAGIGQAIRRELPELVRRVRPRTIGWYPGGPAASITTEMTKDRVRGWPVRRVPITELRAEDIPAICMGFARRAGDTELRHPRDQLLSAQARSAQKLHRGDRWVFTRKGPIPVDAVYAAAGAAHLAKTLRPAPPPLRSASSPTR